MLKDATGTVETKSNLWAKGSPLSMEGGESGGRDAAGIRSPLSRPWLPGESEEETRKKTKQEMTNDMIRCVSFRGPRTAGDRGLHPPTAPRRSAQGFRFP
jgi:hypothetical protein